jgi:hypothetical protein
MGLLTSACVEWRTYTHHRPSSGKQRALHTSLEDCLGYGSLCLLNGPILERVVSTGAPSESHSIQIDAHRFHIKTKMVFCPFCSSRVVPHFYGVRGDSHSRDGAVPNRTLQIKCTNPIYSINQLFFRKVHVSTCCRWIWITSTCTELLSWYTALEGVSRWMGKVLLPYIFYHDFSVTSSLLTKRLYYINIFLVISCVYAVMSSKLRSSCLHFCRLGG